MKILKLELKRMIRSRVLQLSITLLTLISVLGVILYNIYYADIDDSRHLLLSLYNSFTQFTYLVLAFVFVSVFCKDFQNGVYAWYEQLGVSYSKVTIAKFISILVAVFPLLNIVFIIANLLSGNHDTNYFMLTVFCVNLNIIYIIALALFLSVVFKKIIVSTLVMYGLYIFFNGLNLWLFGLFNPTDSNSLSSYYLGKLLNPSQVHYSLNKVDISNSLLCFGAIAIPLVWIFVLIVSSTLIQKYRRR